MYKDYKMQRVNLQKTLSFRTDFKHFNTRAAETRIHRSYLKNNSRLAHIQKTLHRTEKRMGYICTHRSGGTGPPRRSRGSSAPGRSIFQAGSAVSTAARCPKPSVSASSSGCICAACSTGRPSHCQSCCRRSDINVNIKHYRALF